MDDLVSEPDGGGVGQSYAGEVFDIFKGGLQTALAIEAEKARADLQNKSIAGDHALALRTDRGLVQRGQPSNAGVIFSPLVMVAAGAGIALIFFLVLRK